MSATARLGIRTPYNGVMFRSLLEATWASMFDRLGWNWTFEAYEARGWLPDFAISSRYGMGRPVLVEVGPIANGNDPVATEKKAKIDRGDRDHEVLLLGYHLPVWKGRVTAGWLRDENMDWAPAPFGKWEGTEGEQKNEAGLIGFCHGTNSFVDRITGCDDGPCYGAGRVGPMTLDVMWKAARGQMQWKGDPEALVRVVAPLDVDAELTNFVNARQERRHRPDPDVDAMVDQEPEPFAQKELVAALLSTGQITFQQARRQVLRRPDLAGA